MIDRELIEHRDAYNKDLETALNHITENLSNRPEVYKIILFGSYAAGQRDLFTDLDLIVVLDSDKDYITRTAEIYSSLDIGVDLDLLAYTPEEFERMQKKPFIKQALTQGKVLYEKR